LGFKTVHFSEISAKQIEEKNAVGVIIRWLITKEDGAKNFSMRYFEIAPRGYSPLHLHEWEHEVFILEGECEVRCDGEKRKVSEGYAVFIPPNMTHQFINIGDTTLKFICLVPHHK